MVPMCVQKLEVRPTHEPDPHPACGHPLPSDGRGAGGEGSFSVEVHGPNSRAHDVQVFATHEQTQLSISNFQFSIAGPAIENRKSKIVHGPNVRPKVGGPGYP